MARTNLALAEKEGQMRRFPLVLPHDHVKRIIDRGAQILIMSRKLELGPTEIHDALILRRNERHRRDGRHDRQENPCVLTIDVTATYPSQLLQLPYATIRRAGYKTSEDFYTDWIWRRRRIIIDLPVSICEFQLAEEVRYLHQKIHRGYTTNPALAVDRDAPALSESELVTVADFARRRQERDLAAQHARNISIRLRDAARRGDVTEYAKLSNELAMLASAAVRAGTVS
jgi:hypothetical protein